MRIREFLGGFFSLGVLFMRVLHVCVDFGGCGSEQCDCWCGGVSANSEESADGDGWKIWTVGSRWSIDTGMTNLGQTFQLIWKLICRVAEIPEVQVCISKTGSLW